MLRQPSAGGAAAEGIQPSRPRPVEQIRNTKHPLRCRRARRMLALPLPLTLTKAGPEEANPNPSPNPNQGGPGGGPEAQGDRWDSTGMVAARLYRSARR
eukprot:scaffold117004_cov36-Phaeocystis_antarctica.AAC.1